MRKARKGAGKRTAWQKGKLYRKNPNIELRREGTDGILFDKKTGAVHVVNRTGISIWELCDGTHSDKDIVANIIASHHGDKAAIFNEVAEFLQLLIKRDLITPLN